MEGKFMNFISLEGFMNIVVQFFSWISVTYMVPLNYNFIFIVWTREETQ